jgi:hypothetical protein
MAEGCFVGASGSPAIAVRTCTVWTPSAQEVHLFPRSSGRLYVRGRIYPGESVFQQQGHVTCITRVNCTSGVTEGNLRRTMIIPAQGPLFNSFWQAGFECSTHVLKNGKRLDLVSSTRHDVFAGEDYARIRSLGILTAREGLRWHLIEARPGHYDFSSAQAILDAGRKHGVQVVWDLLHFGWPARLDIFDPSWVDAFNAFAAAFGRWLRTELQNNALVAPVNEISFLSWAGGDTAYLNPFAVDRGGELKRQLVRGAVKASASLRAELPDVRLVSPEPVIHIVGDPKRPDDVIQAEQYRSAMFEAWDMLTGRAQPELGGNESFLDVIGLNYYDRNQWWNHGNTIRRHELEYRPFREIVAEVYHRYRRPLFISETGTEDDDRPNWLAYIAEEVRGAIQNGIPVQGICLYPILNHPGWDDDRHCYNGLWDYARPDGTRESYQPLADEIRRLNPQGNNYANPSKLFESVRPGVPLTPSLELCVSTPSTLDEQICPHGAGLLCRGALI